MQRAVMNIVRDEPARDTAVLRRDDMQRDTVAVRAGIRGKLQNGALPTISPSQVWGGKSRGAICDACESAIAPGDVEYEADFTDGDTLRFHWECVLIWDAERAIDPTDQGGPRDARLPRARIE